MKIKRIPFALAVLAMAWLGLSAALAAAELTPGDTLFGRALLAGQNDPALQGDFEFGDVATQRKLAGIPAGHAVAGNRIWGSMVGDGASADDTNVTGKAVNIGVSPLTVDVALSVGVLPHLAVQARGGVNPSGLRAALLHVGAKAGNVAGHAGIVLGAEGSVHPNLLGPSGDGFATALALGRYDRTVVGPGLVVAGEYARPVADLLGGSPSLASNPVMVATVDCLGDVIAAFGQDVHGTEVAVGVLRPADASAQPVEEICAVPAARAVEAEAASLRRSLAGKATDVPDLSEFLNALSRSTLTVGLAGSTHFVRGRLYDRANVPAGVSIHAFELNAVSKMLGATTAPGQ